MAKRRSSPFYPPPSQFCCSMMRACLIFLDQRRPHLRASLIHVSDLSFLCSVRIGLVTDGFSPYNTSAMSYSCWLVFAILYNPPPSLCMKYKYIFFCLIIPGPDQLGTCINVMLKPLIEELKQLWEGVELYDYYQKQKFNIRVAYLWSVHDFRAYNIFQDGVAMAFWHV
jgi:hypothetical protein